MPNGHEIYPVIAGSDIASGFAEAARAFYETNVVTGLPAIVLLGLAFGIVIAALRTLRKAMK